MKEYWVNVIADDPAVPLSELTKYKTQQACKKFADAMGYYFYPVLYRIHVKMKPEPVLRIIATGNCGYPHSSFKEWHECKACNNAPLYSSLKYRMGIFQ